ncbi:hypothetical protein CEY16_00210 [Halalkalibacillus sediminis]|uniref:DUF4760 domain-containing protein n=1 Tax=Halalkalibacillus sediminis TaxID=2018042 RepID=A0A2I0QV44_9BACI|nr:hypothetical protein [Halalkalibacillus sediminis]PKR78217.1 hypothetical protein CEY16_00210 [Halalkalibacillus sediminis]
MSTTAMVTLFISIFSLTISGIVAFITYRYNTVEIRNNARLEHNKLLLEIDRMYIDDPDLWSIYDNHPISKHIERTPLKKGKREAFIYYYLNFFDIIYDFYHKQIYKNKNDRNDWDSWDSYIRHFFQGCTMAREMFKDSSEWYDKDFAKYILKIIREIEWKDYDRFVEDKDEV